MVDGGTIVVAVEFGDEEGVGVWGDEMEEEEEEEILLKKIFPMHNLSHSCHFDSSEEFGFCHSRDSVQPGQKCRSQEDGNGLKSSSSSAGESPSWRIDADATMMETADFRFSRAWTIKTLYQCKETLFLNFLHLTPFQGYEAGLLSGKMTLRCKKRCEGM